MIQRIKSDPVTNIFLMKSFMNLFFRGKAQETGKNKFIKLRQK